SFRSSHFAPSQESENLTPVPSASSFPPTNGYGLRTFHTTTPVFPASGTSAPRSAVTFSTDSAPFRQRSRVKSGRYSQLPLQTRSAASPPHTLPPSDRGPNTLMSVRPWYLTGVRCPHRQTIASPGRSVMFMVVSRTLSRVPGQSLSDRNR